MTLPEALARDIERLEELLRIPVLSLDCRLTPGEHAALTRVLAEVQRLREALEHLRDIEWCGRTATGYFHCPACMRGPEVGHNADCWLAALLETP